MSDLAAPSECSEEALEEPCIDEHRFLFCKQSEGHLYDSSDSCRGDTPFCEPTESGGHECVSH
jgi:hypothetical protein